MGSAEEYTVTGRFFGSALAGALTATGLAVTGDSTGWFAVGVGTVTAVGFTLWLSTRRVQIARMELDGELGGPPTERERRTAAIDTIAIPEAIRTTRLVSEADATEDLGFRRAVDPVATRVSVLVTGPAGAFRTSTSHYVPFDSLELLESPHEVTVVSGGATGDVALHLNADTPADEVPDPRTIRSSYPLPGTPAKIGRGRRAAISMCLGFALAAGATSVALPDTGFVQEAGDEILDAISGDGYMSDVSDEIGDALDDLRQVNAASASHIRSFTMSDTSWDLVAHDPHLGRDFALSDSDDSPSYGETGSTDGTFEISDDEVASFDATYDELEHRFGEYAVEGIVIALPEGGGEPVATWSVTSDSAMQEVSGTLGGPLAQLYYPEDLDASFDHLTDALERFGSGSDEQVFHRLVIRSSSVHAPESISGPDILAQGGAGGVVEIPSGEYAGPATIAAEVGRFPALVDTKLAAAYEAESPFALDDISPEQLNAIVDAAAEELDAGASDRLEMLITVDKVSGDDGQLTVTVQFGHTSPSLYCASIDGDAAAC